MLCWIDELKGFWRFEYLVNYTLEIRYEIQVQEVGFEF